MAELADRLEKEMVDIKKEMRNMMEEQACMRKRISYLDKIMLVHKIVIAVQDLDTVRRLDDIFLKISIKDHDKLLKFRETNMSGPRYISKRDSELKRDEKRVIMYEQFKKMDKNAKNKFAEDYGNIMHIIEPYIVEEYVEPSIETRISAEKWWSDC